MALVVDFLRFLRCVMGNRGFSFSFVRTKKKKQKDELLRTCPKKSAGSRYEAKKSLYFPKRKELANAQTAFRSSREILDFSSRFSTKCRRKPLMRLSHRFARWYC